MKDWILFTGLVTKGTWYCSTRTSRSVTIYSVFHSPLKFLSHHLCSYSDSALSFSVYFFLSRCFIFYLTNLFRTLLLYWGASLLMQTDSYEGGRADCYSSPGNLMLLTPGVCQTLVHWFFYMSSIQLGSFQYTSLPLTHSYGFFCIRWSSSAERLVRRNMDIVQIWLQCLLNWLSPPTPHFLCSLLMSV